MNSTGHSNAASGSVADKSARGGAVGGYLRCLCARRECYAFDSRAPHLARYQSAGYTNVRFYSRERIPPVRPLDRLNLGGAMSLNSGAIAFVEPLNLGRARSLNSVAIAFVDPLNSGSSVYATETTPILHAF